MMNVDLQQLIRTLTPAVRQDLERSAERCVARGGREVLVEDLLLAQLEHRDGLLMRALADAGIEAQTLQATLQPKGEGSASRNPVFAQALVQWLQQALLVAHLELRQTEVDHGALLLALLHHPLQHAGSRYYALLSRLDAQRVQGFVLSQRPDIIPAASDESWLARFTHQRAASRIHHPQVAEDIKGIIGLILKYRCQGHDRLAVSNARLPVRASGRPLHYFTALS